MAILTVNTLSDATATRDLTLRDAIAQAEAGDTIHFSVSGTIQLDSRLGGLTIGKDITIDAQFNAITVQASSSGPAITLTRNASVLINQIEIESAGGSVVDIETGGNLDFRNGSVSGGTAGGIVNGGSTTLWNAVVENNTGALGAGIVNSGTLHLQNTLIQDNTASTSGGGIYNTGTLTAYGASVRNNEANGGNGGGIWSSGSVILVSSEISGSFASSRGAGLYAEGGTAELTSTTLHGNIADLSGGGLYVGSNATSVDVVNATFTGNQSGGDGGGIYVQSFSDALSIANSIAVGNRAGGSEDDLGDGVSTSTTFAGGNVFGQSGLGGSTDQTGATVQDVFAATETVPVYGSPFALMTVGLLAQNGGTGVTRTVAIDSTSIALNAGDAAALPADIFDLDGDFDTTEDVPFDGRGPSFDRSVANRTDSGAFEFEQTGPWFTGFLADGRHNISLAETYQENIVVYNVDATLPFGAVADQNISYSLIGDTYDRDGDGDAAFRIVSNSGALVMNDSDDIDFELYGEQTMDLTVRAFGNSTFTLARVYVTPFDRAETFVVDTAVDEDDGDYSVGDLSLREALRLTNLSNATGADTITFDSALNAVPITLDPALGTLDVLGDVVITGNAVSGAPATTVSGGNQVRVFEIADGVNVSFENLIISSGDVSDGLGGGGILARGTDSGNLPSLHLNNVSMVGHDTTGAGAAISANGTVSVRDSLIYSNDATGDGGAIHIGGDGDLEVVASTLRNNSSQNQGGAIHISTGATALIDSSTINNNVASQGGGLYLNGTFTLSNSTVSGNVASNSGDAGAGVFIGTSQNSHIAQATIHDNHATLGSTGGIYSTTGATIANSIVAGNSALVDANGGFSDEGGTTSTREGVNLWSDPDAIIDNRDDLLETDLLAIFTNSTLSDNGGKVQTVAINPAGPAVNVGRFFSTPEDAGDVDNDGNTFEDIPFDSRGPAFDRRISTVDLGAYEIQVPPPVFSAPAGGVGETSIVENPAANTLIYDLQASTFGGIPDINMTYEILSGNVDNDGDGTNAVSIEASSGIIRVADPGDFDADIDPSISLTVRAENSSGLRTEALLIIGVNALSETFSINDTDASNTLNGTSSSETINGNGGSDWIIPGRGNDTVDGGTERDMVSYSDIASDIPGRVGTFMVDLDLGAGIAEVFGGEVDQLISIERATGSIFADVLRGTEGNDELRGIGDYDWFVATPGQDTLNGGSGLDMVTFVEAQSSGAPVVQDIFAADGSPPTGAAVGGVLLDLANGANNTGLAEGLTLISVERVTGSSHQDVFFGDGEQNDFRGLGGFDWFVSSTGGRERYFGGNGVDTVTYFNAGSGVIASLRNGAGEFGGQETGYGSAGDAIRDLFFEIENLVGSDFDDRLEGNRERNNLVGRDGDDYLLGYGDIDYLKGGLGNDTLDGGAGSDFALFAGNRADYTLTRTSSTEVTIVGADGTDSLINVEYFQFDDQTANIWELSIV